MKMKLLSVVVLVCCVLCWSVSNTAEATVTLKSNVTFPAFIMFGDSIVDTGTNNQLLTAIKSNYPPYGKDFQGGKPTGRFSNGKLPTDLIAERIGMRQYLLPYNTPNFHAPDFQNGVNFASAGSGYDSLTSSMFHVTSLAEQLEQFNRFTQDMKVNIGEEKTNFNLNKGLVLLVSGSNDIAFTYYISRARQHSYSIDQYTDYLVGIASSTVQKIYDAGARKIGVSSVPPLGCLPVVRAALGGLQNCVEEVNRGTQLFNSKLSAMLEKLNQTLPQAKVVYINMYDPLLDIIQNPSKHGFEVDDKACCLPGILLGGGVLCNRLISITCRDDSKYVFWDRIHPTEATYSILIDYFMDNYIEKFA